MGGLQILSGWYHSVITPLMVTAVTLNYIYMVLWYPVHIWATTTDILIHAYVQGMPLLLSLPLKVLAGFVTVD
ncbi:hypothetical protein EAJ53_07415 [Salmonella enterica]|nr:hypothetical protein [Salmonella enterica]EAS6101409.1 hypothetical protein [Salmonella enterica]